MSRAPSIPGAAVGELGLAPDLRAKLDHDTRWRRRICTILTGGHHWYDRGHAVEIRCLDGLSLEDLENDVGFEEIGSFRQCRICFHCD